MFYDNYVNYVWFPGYCSGKRKSLSWPPLVGLFFSCFRIPGGIASFPNKGILDQIKRK